MGLHHVEIWVPDLAGAVARWGWLFDRLGRAAYQQWNAGRSWREPDSRVYVVLEQSPALGHRRRHERTHPGLNHLAFRAGPRSRVDALAREAPHRGWSLMFPDRHPYAGGSGHYAAYLEDADGYEVELVADDDDGR
ncbi:MAG: VOC family protein [Actinomycetota bacterium]|nr:VOC family protein [Actinomycetota bacterium]